MIKKKLVFMSSLSKKIYISKNCVDFLCFDNDDLKPSPSYFLTLISFLNYNINKQNLAKFGFALSLQKPIKGPLCTGEDASGPSLILLNHVNFISFDNDDMKPSKRQFTFLSLISGLNHNINKHNLAKFGFALSLQKAIKVAP